MNLNNHMYGGEFIVSNFKRITGQISKTSWISVSAPFVSSYSNTGFWGKLASAASKIGKKAVYEILILFYTLQRPDIPLKIKAIITGALGYFIFPIDCIPDFIPVVGYSDDIMIVGFCLAYVRSYTTKEEIAKAEEKTNELLS